MNPRRRQPVSKQDPTPWLLQDHAGNVTHKGQLEGGINPDNYFLLVKNQGSFTALPLTAWYTFRPPQRRVAMSLEEAEAEMEKKHNSHFSGTGRLSQAIARNEGVLDLGLHPEVHAACICRPGFCFTQNMPCSTPSSCYKRDTGSMPVLTIDITLGLLTPHAASLLHTFKLWVCVKQQLASHTCTAWLCLTPTVLFNMFAGVNVTSQVKHCYRNICIY